MPLRISSTSARVSLPSSPTTPNPTGVVTFVRPPQRQSKSSENQQSHMTVVNVLPQTASSVFSFDALDESSEWSGAVSKRIDVNGAVIRRLESNCSNLSVLEPGTSHLQSTESRNGASNFKINTADSRIPNFKNSESITAFRYLNTTKVFEEEPSNSNLRTSETTANFRHSETGIFRTLEPTVTSSFRNLEPNCTILSSKSRLEKEFKAFLERQLHPENTTLPTSSKLEARTNSNDFNIHRTELDDVVYEPLFLATTKFPQTSSSTCELPGIAEENCSLLRRRSECRRPASSKKQNGRRSVSVGPTPKLQFQKGGDGRLMSLREQQVIKLRTEIAHEAGVRITLRKKDCTGTIAFVNCFEQVFVAGWKQREHPYLHNTFHVGDQIVSVCGTKISNAEQTQQLIRNEAENMVEFIIRRVPHGKVFALKRQAEGQPLGIIREGNTAEIQEIIPGGLAEQHEVPSRTQTLDRLTVTTWTITEINHRTLNLFFKHNEISERLNAVGRDISILIQPSDLVKCLKKQLKQIKSHKEYVIM